MSATDATVFVVDDDASVRQGLARLIRSAGWGVEAFASARDFLNREPFPGIGCVVLDVRMPGGTGPELHERMRERGEALPVIYLTGHGDVPTGVQAMKNGAVDFLLKPVDDDVLLGAIQVAVERHRADRTLAAGREAIQLRLARLSAREREVMEQVILGRRNKQNSTSSTTRTASR